MTAKKKDTKKVTRIKKEIEEIKEIKEEKKEYKPLFNKPMVFKKVVSQDLNYYGIKQFLKNKLNLDFFKRIKENGEIKKEEKKFDLKEELNRIWFIYCEYWNNLFNKEVNKDE